MRLSLSHYNPRSIATSTTTSTTTSRTRVDVAWDYENPATLNLHPETAEAYEAAVEKLTSAERDRYDGSEWVTGELVPGLTVTVFVPACMRKEVPA